MSKPFFSSDGHATEPADLWQTRLPKGMRDRAVHMLLFDEFFKMMDENGTSISDSWRFRRADGTIIGDTVEEHMRDLDGDGIWGEVLYPSLGMQTFMPDPELAIAHARVYNDWLAEHYVPHERFVPIAVCPVTDVPAAIAEIDRVAEMGLQGILLPLLPPKPYYLPEYEDIWTAACANDLTVSFHVATGFAYFPDGTPMPQGKLFDAARRAAIRAMDPPVRDAHRTLQIGVDGSIPIQNVLASLIGSGVLARHESLRIFSVENHAYWIPSLLGGMEKAWTLGIGQPVEHLAGCYDPDAPLDDQPLLTDSFWFNTRWRHDLRPSEYFRRQVKATFMDDPMAVACRHIIGVDVLVWGADYPHPEATFPRSRELVDTLFADCTPEEREAMTGGTISKVYGIEVPELVG